jgi:excisionase family DNA binding protein
VLAGEDISERWFRCVSFVFNIIQNIGQVVKTFLGQFLTKWEFCLFLVRYHSNKIAFQYQVGVFVVSVTPQQWKHNGRPVLTTGEASRQSGLSRDYILRLLSTGRIEGVQLMGREWMVYEDSLMAFLAEPRSPGRKGPRKKRIIQHTNQGDRVLLSTAEAQELTGYARDTLLRLLRSGRINGEKSGRTWLIYEDSLLAYKHRKHPITSESESSSTDASEPPVLSPSPEPKPPLDK